MMNLWRTLAAAAVLSGAAIAGIAAQPHAPAHPPAHHREACGDIPLHYSRTTFHAFSEAASELDATNFSTFDERESGEFGHAFTHRVPQRRIAAEMAIYGYDYIGAHRGYLLFYRRPEGSWQPGGALPAIKAPNGQLLPSYSLPPDLNPQYPPPELLVQRSPFLGMIVLPQQIVALPCDI